MAVFEKSYPYYLGLALSGGGAKGFAHLGALNALEAYALRPNIIVGASAGALAGVFYADGFAPEEIAELFKNKEFKEFVEFTMSHSGFFKSTGIEKFLKNNLRSKRFEQLQIPLKVVATDWENAQSVVFSEGDHLIDSVVASCSVPMVFKPKYIDGVPYVDGGLLKNFPVSVIRDLCRFVIGVNVSLVAPLPEKVTIKSNAERVFKLMSNSNTLVDSMMCDILVEVSDIEKYFMFDLKNIDEIMKVGHASTERALNATKGTKVLKRYKRRSELESIIKDKIGKLKSITE